MKNKVRSLLIIFISVLTFSCSTSNDVAGKFGIQKRKYTKGFSISKKNNGKHSKTIGNEEILVRNSKQNSIDTQVQETESPVEVTSIETIASSETNDLSTIIDDNTVVTKVKTTSKIRKKHNQLNSIKNSVKSNVIENIIKNESKNTALKTTFKVSDEVILYYILAVLIPFIAVGLVTDWDVTLVVISILLSILFIIPGIIFGIIIVSNNT